MSILRLIAQNGTIAGGEILFEGKDLLKKTEKQMRAIRGKDISMIFQDPMSCLNPVFTIGYQLEEVLKLHNKSMKKAERRARIVEMLRLVGMSNPEERLKQYPHELSGGMRQRIMIAMSLLLNPKLLIADEPTTALDVTIQAQIMDLIIDLSKRLNTAVILITRDLVLWSPVQRRKSSSCTPVKSSNPRRYANSTTIQASLHAGAFKGTAETRHGAIQFAADSGFYTRLAAGTRRMSLL